MRRNPREVEYVAKGNVLPVCQVLVRRDKAPKASVPARVQDYAFPWYRRFRSGQSNQGQGQVGFFGRRNIDRSDEGFR
jgi:hypothetical protein